MVIRITVGFGLVVEGHELLGRRSVRPLVYVVASQRIVYYFIYYPLLQVL
jgi:hypothetical protein